MDFDVAFLSFNEYKYYWNYSYKTTIRLLIIRLYNHLDNVDLLTSIFEYIVIAMYFLHDCYTSNANTRVTQTHYTFQ